VQPNPVTGPRRARPEDGNSSSIELPAT
jgi:hypothetical protein